MINAISQVVGLLIQSATLVTLAYALVRFLKKPSDTVNERIDNLENWKERVEERLAQGTVHFKTNDESNRVTQNALVAIMDALGSMESVPPDARTEIKARKKDLMDYLTDK